MFLKTSKIPFETKFPDTFIWFQGHSLGPNSTGRTYKPINHEMIQIDFENDKILNDTISDFQAQYKKANLFLFFN